MSVPDSNDLRQRLLRGDHDQALRRLLNEPPDRAAHDTAPDPFSAKLLGHSAQLGRSRLMIAAGLTVQHFTGHGNPAEISCSLHGITAENTASESAELSRLQAQLISGEKPRVVLLDACHGEPLNWTFFTMGATSRRRFDELLNFSDVRLPATGQASAEAFVGSLALGADDQSSDQGSAPGGSAFSAIPFQVQIQSDTQKAVISTTRQPGEKGFLFAAVRFDHGRPYPLVLEADPSAPRVLIGRLPLPQHSHQARQALISVNELRLQDLAWLSPREVVQYLATRPMHALPLTPTRDGFEFSPTERSDRFLQQHPDAVVALRVAPEPTEGER
jgi:hypothetical protein